MKKFRKIGVLTSGGDAPGMNAAVKAVVNRANELGIDVIGVNGGYAALINGDLIDLSKKKIFNVVSEGGTILYSSRCPEFATEEGMQTAIQTCKDNQIDALICIGGDGTWRGATDISQHGIPAIGIPGTIDNDITSSDYTIGLDSAVNTTVELMDKLHDTCESHNRVVMVEAMGRHCGHIALYSAISSGATAVMVPEMPFEEAEVLERIRKARESGKRSISVVVAEGVVTPDGKSYAEYLTDKLNDIGYEARFIRPGHIVRGGNPTMRDRVTAAQMGTRAVELLVEGKDNLVLVELNGGLVELDINLALVADKKYKGKLKEGMLDRFNAEELALIDKLVERKRRITADLYHIANEIMY